MLKDFFCGFRGFSGVVLLLVLVLTAGTGCGKKNQAAADRYSALGAVLGAKTRELAGGHGSIVLAVSDSDNEPYATFSPTVAAFTKALGGGVQVATVRVPTAPVVLRGVDPLKPEQLVALLQQQAAADCLVLFTGVPALTPDEIAQLPSPRPKVVAAVVFNPPSRAMFDGKVLWLAALHKPMAEGGPSPGASAQEQFDAAYMLATPENAGSLLP